ncbi:MAG: glycosyltransferase family 2 protein [Candidatus Hydrogenedentes bacterium]|nr:glycosyltransferase family 2 protein [Candidatus Hydrogenedentota bacterium]
MPRISVLTSLFCAEPYIQELYDRSKAALERITEDYEIVFVDDGSPDGGNAVVQRLIQEDPRVRLIELSKNFGQHRALLAGLQHVRGELVFMIDSDLEEDPELLEVFYRTMSENESEIDVVYGVMEKRKGGLLERVSGALFYGLMSTLSEIPMPRDVMGARLMKAGFVDSLLRHGESQPFLGGLLALTGYHQVAVPCEKRSKGTTTYNFRRKVSLALNAFLSYSTRPLTWIVGVGGVLMLVGAAALLVVALRGEPSTAGGADLGWLLASLWFLSGVIVLAVGIVGVYVGRIFGQVKNRPNAIIRKIYN